MNAEPLWCWINERHAIYLRKAARDGETIPSWARANDVPETSWPGRLTDDEILAAFRFTNVFRELDRVTVWIRENIREPYADHPNLWYMLAVARYINWPPTLAELIEEKAWPDNDAFTPELMTEALEARRARGEKIETGAYMIRAESDPKAPWYKWSKQRYVSEVVLGNLWERKAHWVELLGRSRELRQPWEELQLPEYTGWGPFMAYQFVLELHHTRYLAEALDKYRWAAVGPGSKRGLNRLAGRPVKAALSQARAVEEMRSLLLASSICTASWVPKLALEDVQNSLCETDKYLRAQSGDGRPRTKYVRGRGY